MHAKTQPRFDSVTRKYADKYNTGRRMQLFKRPKRKFDIHFLIDQLKKLSDVEVSKITFATCQRTPIYLFLIDSKNGGEEVELGLRSILYESYFIKYNG